MLDTILTIMAFTGLVVGLVWVVIYLRRYDKTRKAECIHWIEEAASTRSGWSIDETVCDCEDLEIDAFKRFASFHGFSAFCYVSAELVVDGMRCVIFVPYLPHGTNTVEPLVYAAICLAKARLQAFQVTWDEHGPGLLLRDESTRIHAKWISNMLPAGALYAASEEEVGRLFTAKVQQAVRSEERLCVCEAVDDWVLFAGDEPAGPDSFTAVHDAASVIVRALAESVTISGLKVA